MKTKKILTALFAGVVAGAALTVSSMACETCNNSVSKWDGTSIDRTWYDNDPDAETYTITSAAQFAGLSDICNTVVSNTGIHPFKGQKVYLAVNVDLGDFDFKPIGDATGDHKYFYGSFDGQGHTISNLNIDGDSGKYVGLFGKTGNPNYNQTFENVTLENVTINSNAQFVGALIGRADKSVVSDVCITGDIDISGYSYVGGVIGHSYAKISDCSVIGSGSINGTNWQVGGLVGAHYVSADAVITDCTVSGDDVNGLSVYAYNGAVAGAVGYVGKVDGVDTAVLDGIIVENVDVKATNNYGIGYVTSGAFNATNSVAANVKTTLGDEVIVPSDATQTKAVASVNGEYFTDLATAFKSVNKDKTTIEILSDITIDTDWQCNFGRGFSSGTFNNNEVTIEGNNHVIKFTGKLTDGNTEAVICTGAPITVKQLTFDLSECPSYRRVIAAKTNVTIDRCTFIGNPANTKTTYAVIVGESGGDLLKNTELYVVSSDFSHFNYGISDNRNGQDIKEMIINGNEFNNASVQISASDVISFNSNAMENSWVRIRSFTPSSNLTVTAENNSLAANGSTSTEQNYIRDGEIVTDSKEFILPVAKIGANGYFTLTDAISAANDGDIVYVAPGTYTDELVINKSIVLTGDPAYGDTTTLTASPEKPVIVIKDTTNGGVEYHAPNVVFDNLVFKVAEDATGAGWNVSALGYYYEIVADRNGLTVTNCDFINNSELAIGAIAANIGKYTIKNNTFKNFSTAVWSYVDHGALDTVVIDGNKFENVDNIANVYWGVENTAATIKVENNKSTDGSTAQISITDFGKTKTPRVTAIPSITVYGNDAEVVLGNMDETNIYSVDTGLVHSYASEGVLSSMDGYLPDGVVYVQYGTDNEEMFIVENGYVKEEAQNVKLVFEENSYHVDGKFSDELDNSVWDIYLVANEGGILHRLNSADFTFELTTDGKDAMAYEIIATNAEIKINNVNNDANRYEFHYDGKTGTITDTATKIKIGTVKFTGFGGYTFAVDTTEVAENTNQVHTTTFVDNIVDSFIVGGVVDAEGNVTNELYVNSTIDSTIIVPTKTLTINIDFPNSVENNAVAYQQMKVVVSGGELEAPLTIDLGTKSEISDFTSATYDNKDDIKVTVTDLYTIKVENLLEINTAYNVEVSGAGYRTAKYTVTMTDNKTLNFWNNVKDNKVEVEEGKDTSAKNVTFLAGDIVKDSLINIYDLSAVVSYFGEINLSETNNKDYAKYDLNRDGKIDSKDVAYVLVSWNN